MRPPACRIAIKPIRLRNVHLTADDWFDTGLPRRLIKSDRSEKISMIRNGYGRHFVTRRSLRKHVVIAGAV